MQYPHYGHKKNGMKITKLSEEQKDKCRELCNFTKEERQYFELKLSKCSNVQMAFKMNVSESQISKLAAKVKLKISRVL